MCRRTAPSQFSEVFVDYGQPDTSGKKQNSPTTTKRCKEHGEGFERRKCKQNADNASEMPTMQAKCLNALKKRGTLSGYVADRFGKVALAMPGAERCFKLGWIVATHLGRCPSHKKRHEQLHQQLRFTVRERLLVRSHNLGLLRC
jgi:hypothetical protein